MFRIGTSPLHGVGWFATETIPSDTPIYDEPVSIRVPLDLTKQWIDEKHLDEVLSNLSDDDRAAIMNLSGDEPIHKLWMNGSPLIDHERDFLGNRPRKEMGIYLKCARLNHSCRPNAVRASDVGNSMSVVSQKEIKAGEEITISYMDDNFATLQDRHRQMISKIKVGHLWGSCQCNLCTGSEEMIHESDNRRRLLYAYRQQLLYGSMSAEMFVTIFLPLMAAEGLVPSLMGIEAVIKMANLMSGLNPSAMTRESINSMSFEAGTRCVLHKLKARPELNGQKGTVVYELDEGTGRVGILLDSWRSTSKKPIAVKPENLCITKY